MNGRSMLKVENVRFAYSNSSVLNGIELEVFRGEMLGLVGPNGVGKSTLISLMNGVIKPQHGRVLMNGEDIQSLSQKQTAARIATVPQNPVVTQGFRALDIVMMGRNPHLRLMEWEGQKDLQVCQNAMELTDTWRFADRFVMSLSGGERQRVFIARALAQEAQLLILDEPTAHLDIGFQSEVLDVIEEISRASGMTVVTAMHDMTLAAQYCQRIALMGRGVVHSLGRPEEVLTSEAVFEVFGVRVSLMKHPIHGTPVVLPAGRSPLKPTIS